MLEGRGLCNKWSFEWFGTKCFSKGSRWKLFFVEIIGACIQKNFVTFGCEDAISRRMFRALEDVSGVATSPCLA